jgi:hypothetical protein
MKVTMKIMYTQAAREVIRLSLMFDPLMVNSYKNVILPGQHIKDMRHRL